MNYPKVYTPTSIEEAFELLNKNSKSEILAGGTDLLVEIEKKNKKPKELIYIGAIEDIRQIKENDEYISIGSMVTFSELIESSIIKNKVYCLWQATKEIGSIQIRNIATIGGNIANGAAVADSVAALLAIEAELEILTLSGEIKTMIIEEYLSKKNQEKHIILKIKIPIKYIDWRTAFSKLGTRRYVTISKLILSCSVLLSDDKKKIKNSRIVLGAISDNSILDKKTMDWILEQRIDSEFQTKLSSELSKRIREFIPERASCEYKEIAIKGLVDDIFEILFN